jgi:type II secretory pathway component PulK
MGVNGERGQASVELVAVLPCILLVAAVVWQLLLVGHTAWLTAQAARAGARADAVGRDAEAAARSALPRSLERGLEVDSRAVGGVRVSVRIPLLLDAWEAPVRVSAVSALGTSR